MANRRDSVSKRKGRALEMLMVAEAVKGSEAAWSQLYAEHSPRVMALMRKLTKGDQSRSEDLCQDTFLKVYTKLSTYKGQSALSTWIYRLAVNIFLMSLRKKSHTYISLDEVLDFSSNPHHNADGAAHTKADVALSYRDRSLELTPERLTLIEAIEALPPGYKKHFIMHDVQGLEHSAIAKKTRNSIGGSKSQLSKSRHSLRVALGAPVGSKAKGGKRRGGI